MFENELFLVVIDYYSKWIEVSHPSAQTTRNVVVALRVMFSRLGIPSMVRSENGGCFVTEEFHLGKQTFCRPDYHRENLLQHITEKTNFTVRDSKQGF